MDDIAVTEMAEATRIMLPPILDMLAAEGLAAVLTAGIHGGKGLAIDAQAVERLSTPCLQALLAADKTCRDGGMAFGMTACSPAFRAAMADFGLAAVLSAWMGEE